MYTLTRGQPALGKLSKDEIAEMIRTGGIKGDHRIGDRLSVAQLCDIPLPLLMIDQIFAFGKFFPNYWDPLHPNTHFALPLPPHTHTLMQVISRPSGTAAKRNSPRSTHSFQPSPRRTTSPSCSPPSTLPRRSSSGARHCWVHRRCHCMPPHTGAATPL